VSSGEENEEPLFKSRAKLYRFIKEDTYGDEVRTNYWKERGLGDVKVMKHKTSQECRLLMRQEKTLKICLNHKVQPATELSEMKGSDGKAWTFIALDFADGEAKTDTFALKFASQDIAQDFKKYFDNARELNSKGKSSSGGGASGSTPAKSLVPAAPGSPPKPPALTSVDKVAANISSMTVQAISAPLVGGYQKRSPDEVEIKNVAKFATEKIGQGELVKVASVKSQVVAGMNFRMALHIKHSTGEVFAHVVTVYKPLPHENKELSMTEHVMTAKVM